MAPVVPCTVLDGYDGQRVRPRISPIAIDVAVTRGVDRVTRCLCTRGDEVLEFVRAAMERACNKFETRVSSTGTDAHTDSVNLPSHPAS